MTNDEQRNLRLAQQALDNAIGLLRTASDKLKLASDQLKLARDSWPLPGEHERSP